MKRSVIGMLCGVALMAMACSKSESESTINIVGPNWRDIKPATSQSSGSTSATTSVGAPGKPGINGTNGTNGVDGTNGGDGGTPKVKDCGAGHHSGQGNEQTDCGKDGKN